MTRHKTGHEIRDTRQDTRFETSDKIPDRLRRAQYQQSQVTSHYIQNTKAIILQNAKEDKNKKEYPRHKFQNAVWNQCGVSG